MYLARVSQFVRSPTMGPLLIFGTLGGASLAAAVAFSDSLLGSGVVFLLALCAFTLVLDIFFRLMYRIYYGTPYINLGKVRFSSLYVEPHPYIPFVNKKNHKTEKPGPANYPLHQGRFTFGEYRTNNLGFANGESGSAPITIPKPAGVIRVVCIGASTTQNYLEENGKVYSYPLELECYLLKSGIQNFEVHNCGQGGYNSADILVRFILQIIDTGPDVVVLYHAYNDIRAYFTPGFSSDYSHARRNLGEVYWKFKLASFIPEFHLKVANYLINQWLPVNVRYSLLSHVTKGIPDYRLSPDEGLNTYRRNLQTIADVCKARGIKLILSTYCHYLHVGIRDDPLHLLYAECVAKENQVVREISRASGIPLVDNATLMPMEDTYFVDSIHFSPAGMTRIAQNVGAVLIGMAKERR